MKTIKKQFKLKTFFMAIAILFTSTAMAQEDENDREYKTLFGNQAYSHGAYGALMINYTQIDNSDVILIGAKGGWIINQAVTIGLAGYGLASDNDFAGIYDNDVVQLAGGYGGLLIEPILAPRFPIHVAFPIIIGAGGIAYVDNFYDDYDDEWNTNIYDSDAFFVIEPGVEIEMNVVRFMRIGLAATYRHTSNLKLDYSSSDMLNGMNFGISLKFGKFWDNEHGVRYR